MKEESPRFLEGYVCISSPGPPLPLDLELYSRAAQVFVCELGLMVIFPTDLLLISFTPVSESLLGDLLPLPGAGSDEKDEV